MRRQATVSTVRQNRTILDYAKTVYTTTEADVELINLIMADWYNNRQRDSKSGSLRRIETALQEILDILRRNDASNTDI